MYKCQLSDVLKALIALLFVSLVACSSNSGQAPASTGQWFTCQAADSRSGWSCREGYFEDSASVSVPASEHAPELSRSTDSISESEQVEPVVKTALTDVTASSEGEITDAGLGVNYSIQLAAFSTEERRENYLQQTPIARSELILERGQRDGQSWWLVLYGRYQNYQEALEAQRYLVSTYDVSNTWIKPVN